MAKINKVNKYDWRRTIEKPSFPYKSIDDPKYIEDRNELFREGGNGWWILKGTPQYNKHLKKIKEQLIGKKSYE